MLLKAINLSKSFETNCLFDQLSFTLNEHEILAVVGPSGIGKSTLIRCLCQLESLTSGQIIKEAPIGLVFQDFQLFPHLTVLENLTLAAKYHGISQAEQKALDLLTYFHIADKADAHINTLSGGQKQRIAIARALMLDPKILCFDEPTSALDAQTSQQVVSIIRQLQTDGLGIIIVSHDQAFIQQLTDKIIRFQ